jgi:rubredoxin
MVAIPRGNGVADKVPKPLLSYTRSMVEPTRDWKFIGDYAIWTGNRSSASEPYLLLELRGRKVLPIPASSTRAIAHPIVGQTWFHVDRLFGFWMRADVDSVWVDAPGENGHFYTVLVGGADNRPGRVSSGWLCPSCGIIFNDQEYDVSRRRFQKFLDETQVGVAHFNADQSNRTCPSCGAVHPLTYGFLQGQAA